MFFLLVSGLNVDHAQNGKAHLNGVMIVSKGKRVVGVKPAVVEVSAILGLAQTDHVLNPPLPKPSSMFAPHPNRCGVCCLANVWSICRHFFAEENVPAVYFMHSQSRGKTSTFTTGKYALRNSGKFHVGD